MTDGALDLALRASLEGGQLQALAWERGGLPVVSGTMDGAVDVTGTGRTMAGLVSKLAGSGSITVNDGRFNALNPDAITAVMKSAEDAGDPDEEQARETFAILFGSGALPFGRAAGSFSVSGGVLDIPTVSMAAQGTTVLADAAINLNNFTLSSAWTIRQTTGIAAESQPFVTVRFSGPLADPQRQIDLAPLLDLIRSRNLQRQLDELEALEAERRRLEAQRPPPVVPPPAEPPRAGVPGAALGEAPIAPIPSAVPQRLGVDTLMERGSALMNPAMPAEAASTALPFTAVPRDPAEALGGPSAQNAGAVSPGSSGPPFADLLQGGPAAAPEPVRQTIADQVPPAAEKAAPSSEKSRQAGDAEIAAAKAGAAPLLPPRPDAAG
jgi:hypothetical protein